MSTPHGESTLYNDCPTRNCFGNYCAYPDECAWATREHEQCADVLTLADALAAAVLTIPEDDADLQRQEIPASYWTRLDAAARAYTARRENP